MTKEKNNPFTYESCRSGEHKEIADNLLKHLVNQTSLVYELFEEELAGFSWEDVHNLYNDNEEDSTPPEIYSWYLFTDMPDFTDKLNKAGIPYIDNEFGFWIGRCDCGSAMDLYFLPSLLNALYFNNNK